MGRRRRQRMGEKVQGIRSVLGTNRQGEIKNCIGNGEAEERVCTTDGHELRWGGMLEEWVMGGGR